MAVLAKLSMPACKLCKHPKRPEIDALLELRSKHTRGPDGKLTHTIDVVLRTLGEWGVENPTLDNIKNHWRKHCEVVEGTAAEEHASQLEGANAEMLEILDAADDSVDGYLRSLIGVSKHRLRRRLLRNEDPGVTVDHALKASAELTKRSHNEAQHELMTALAGGIALAVTGHRPPVAIDAPPDPDIIEGEFEVVEE